MIRTIYKKGTTMHDENFILFILAKEKFFLDKLVEEQYIYLYYFFLLLVSLITS